MPEKTGSTHELSVIVPVLNEADILPELFRTLSEQEGVELELVVCDGGSSDGTAELARELAADAPFPVRVVTTPPGRARQMNAGAAAGAAATFLFLHADSLFPDPLAFRQGLDRLAAEIGRRGNERVAGRFALRFRRQNDAFPRGYYHFECKARLNRRGCTHGDQGFLMRRGFFAEVGPFDDTIPMMAETRLAEAVRVCGEWCLLPAEIHTSARRFEVEGLRERQTLNAIIANFAAMGWESFFRELPRLYGSQESAERLDLPRFLSRTGELMAALPLRNRIRLWLATGRYVRDNAWQIPLLLDTRRNFRRGVPPGEGSLPLLRFHDRHLDRLTDHPPGRLAAALLTWLWFRLASAR
ncbi:MAG TPA: TIGR04283 family arsenosugar biosynthesis glycosyltransferase [Geobacteraceae bacterium]|nr:TIGR04283 family arsenosugar biosynthesis glycosyltransferase [Geobacteraceae bacterium]